MPGYGKCFVNAIYQVCNQNIELQAVIDKLGETIDELEGKKKAAAEKARAKAAAKKTRKADKQNMNTVEADTANEKGEDPLVASDPWQRSAVDDDGSTLVDFQENVAHQKIVDKEEEENLEESGSSINLPPLSADKVGKQKALREKRADERVSGPGESPEQQLANTRASCSSAASISPSNAPTVEERRREKLAELAEILPKLSAEDRAEVKAKYEEILRGLPPEHPG